MRYVSMSIILALPPCVFAAPAPEGAQVAPPHPMITAKATLMDRTPSRVVGRDLSDAVGSILSDLGSAIPSFVASGVPNFFQDFPSGDDVLSSLGINSAALAATPTMVLNIP